jgi:murein L,D-transpeptidase YafK
VIVGAAVAVAAPQDGGLPDSGAREPPDAGDEAGDLDGGGIDDSSAPVDDALDTAPHASTLADMPTAGGLIFVDKSERQMVVQDGRGYRETFRVALGPHPEGDKELEGDGRTPEGDFYVCHKVRHNRFHRFLGLSYPAPDDATRGQALGLLQPIELRSILRAFRRREMPPWRTALGGGVGIHGYGRRRLEATQHAAGADWTDGCIAVSNDEIERVYAHVRVGTRVVIVP